MTLSKSVPEGVRDENSKKIDHSIRKMGIIAISVAKTIVSEFEKGLASQLKNFMLMSIVIAC